MMFQSIVMFMMILPIIIAFKETWSYETMTNWSHDAHYCRGNLQSPIDLRFNVSQYEPRLRRIYFQKKRSSPHLPQLINTGYTAQLSFSNSNYIVKNIAPCSEDYIVDQLHFHWGHSSNNTDGSEHLLEGRAYPLEMHIVSYSSLFSSVKEAMINARGLAVIGAFFELSDEPNEYLEPIINATRYIRHRDEYHPISNEFRLIPLIGEGGIRRYYRYDGSLTTPPCYESVIWTILQEPLKISPEQLYTFRSLHENRYKLMQNTYRLVHPLGARKLLRSFPSRVPKNEFERLLFIMGTDGQDPSYRLSSVFLLINCLILLFIELV